jgi:4-aminobutyrate--pyruvate transaminase
VGPHLQSELRHRFEGHELVGEIRGVGLIAAMELVADRATHKNFDPAAKIGARLVKLCEHHGVIARVLPNDAMAFSPPLIITTEEVDLMLNGVSAALDDLTMQLRREAMGVVA